MEVTIKAEKFDETQKQMFTKGQNLPGRKKGGYVYYINYGEILVLGGLQEVKMDSSRNNALIIAIFPTLVKNSFIEESLQYTPTELLIFLRPTIIDPKAERTH